MRNARLTLLLLTTIAVATAPFVGSVLAAPMAGASADSVAVDDTAMAAQHDNVTGPVPGMPSGVDAFTNTTALTPGQVSPTALAGVIRVESEYASNTTIDLQRNTTNETALNVTVTGHAENVTFFVQTKAIAASQNLSNVTAMVDGEPIQYGLTNASGATWVGINVDHFSSRTVTFSQNGTPSPGPGGNASFAVSGLDAPSSVEGGENITTNATITNTGNASGQTQVAYRVDGRRRGAQTVRLGAGNDTTVSFDLDTSGLSSGNHTHGVSVDGDNATATLLVKNGTPKRGPVSGGMPPGVEAFTSTTALNPGQVSPPSLSGKIRVESNYTSNTTIELKRNNSGETAFNVTVTGHAKNVTFFFQTEAIAASQNVSNVTAMVDGEPIQFGLTNASGSAWVGIEVDHFSSRTVTFTSTESVTRPTLPGLSTPAGNLDGDALLEDVDGDGDGDVFDALTYYNNRKSDAVRNNSQQFDFDGDGTVGTVFDAIALYNKLQTL